MSTPEKPQLIPTAETQPLQERRVTIEGKTLIIPGYVQEKMRELDKVVEGLVMATEIGGFGFTRGRGDTVEVVEFMGPEKSKIFNLNGLFVSSDQKRLAELVAQSRPLQLHVADTTVSVIPDGEDNEENWFNFGLTPEGKIDWGFLRNELQMLIGSALPDTIQVSKEVITSRNAGQTDSQKDSIVLDNNWDVVVSGGELIVTPNFMKRVHQKAKELDAPIGFHMHHHPSLELMAALYKDQPVEKRRRAYEILLNYSKMDVDTLRGWDIDFFEIRAFGNIDNVCDPAAGITSAYYRTNTIK